MLAGSICRARGEEDGWHASGKRNGEAADEQPTHLPRAPKAPVADRQKGPFRELCSAGKATRRPRQDSQIDPTPPALHASAALVPKLHLGMPLGAKFHFARRECSAGRSPVWPDRQNNPPAEVKLR